MATTALLIGSGIYDGHREHWGGGGGKKTSKKQGIRPCRTKKGDMIPPDEWSRGDLRNMKGFVTRMGAEVYDTFNYTEQNADGSYSMGKTDVSDMIREFFDQQYKTKFVLYYTGHGDQDGSWLFPVTRTLKHTPTALSRSRGESEAASRDARNAFATASVVVHGAVDGDAQPARKPLPSVDAGPALEAISEGYLDSQQQDHAPPDDVSHVTTISAATSTTSISSYDIIENVPPKPARKFYDFVTFKDIVEAWDEMKRGREDKRLVMILDCCHSGKWVHKVNGELDAWAEEDAEEASSRATEFRNRRDISIQAACRPSEASTVAQSQLCSIFTKSFVAAQNRGLTERFLLTAFDHLLVLNVVSIAASPVGDVFTPLSSAHAAFGGIQFFDSFDDMHLKT